MKCCLQIWIEPDNAWIWLRMYIISMWNHLQKKKHASHALTNKIFAFLKETLSRRKSFRGKLLPALGHLEYHQSTCCMVIMVLILLTCKQTHGSHTYICKLCLFFCLSHSFILYQLLRFYGQLVHFIGIFHLHTPWLLPLIHSPSHYLLRSHGTYIIAIRKFFLTHNQSFRWHLGDYEKHIFFHLKACERRNFDFCVFLRMCSGSIKNRFI